MRKRGKEQQRDKNTTAKDDRVNYFHHPFQDRHGIEGEEQHLGERFGRGLQKRKEKTTETSGASEGKEQQNEKQLRSLGNNNKGSNGGHRILGFQGAGAELVVGHGVQWNKGT